MVDKQVARNGEPSVLTSQSMTQSDENSSFATSYGDQSSDALNEGQPGGGFMHPSDMILEQSNDDDSSFIDRRPRRAVDIACDQENISLIEQDYIIVDPITESYRLNMSQNRNRRSFFEENLRYSEQSPLANRSPDLQCSPNVNVHISQLSLPGLTDCEEQESESETWSS